VTIANALGRLLVDLGWNRLGLQTSEVLDVVADRDVWWLSLELLLPLLSRI